ncbi:unnamed protein product [Vitrella brassicaformis CCMP3155]|uniref:Uncharacterized protein n=1 Tax=Vitrella brassicaformis (strain CCMP3155) TaxID=1169540 RepID=A0A0G4EJK4_VITBC|nr:unnamed protein product [Vitrella brassicaformis CCMP3155]|eukprot:CEL96716.1 unnamed protein product [Vitrella brassicaformis CCMP3155]
MKIGLELPAGVTFTLPGGKPEGMPGGMPGGTAERGDQNGLMQVGQQGVSLHSHRTTHGCHAKARQDLLAEKGIMAEMQDTTAFLQFVCKDLDMDVTLANPTPHGPGGTEDEGTLRVSRIDTNTNTLFVIGDVEHQLDSTLDAYELPLGFGLGRALKEAAAADPQRKGRSEGYYDIMSIGGEWYGRTCWAFSDGRRVLEKVSKSNRQGVLRVRPLRLIPVQQPTPDGQPCAPAPPSIHQPASSSREEGREGEEEEDDDNSGGKFSEGEEDEDEDL